MTNDWKPGRITPFDRIRESIDLPEDLKSLLPRKWEKLGHVLLLKLPPELQPHKDVVAQTYATILEVDAVLNDLGVEGPLRQPKVEVILGDDIETCHLENGVHFHLDPAKVMFSSGNIDERIRMASVSGSDEVVADMFAGIGYFSVPIAVHSGPREVLACELNPDAYRYLEMNIERNGVGDIVKPLLGDCREVLEKGIGDRVLMGYVGSTHEFLDKAF